MVEEDFYSGQPVNLPSPDNKQTEIEAANMASFGKYDYDPAMRAINQQMIYPGGYGYNAFPMNPPVVGIGTPYRYSPYGNVQPTYGAYQYGSPNPVFQQSFGMNLYQQQMPTTIHIPGVGMNGEYLAPLHLEETIDQLSLEYWTKMQEKQAKDDIDRRNSVYGYNSYGGFNYYGVPYYNPYQYNSINGEISQKVDEIKTKAREARLQFDQRLSRLAHNISNDGTPDDIIKERYEGRTIEIQRNSQFDPMFLQEQMRLERMVPFDNSQFYRDQYARVSKEFNEIIPSNSDMQTTFQNMGIVAAKWDLEDEEHRRRDVSTMYQSGENGYKYFVRKKAEERYAKEKGIQLPSSNQFNPIQAKQQALQQFPTLNQSVKLADDGTLSVTCNVGSHAGQVYSVNQNEAKYQENRERFDRFLSSIPGSIYKNYNGG